MNNFKAIGLMSGTSLDGLDICYAEFYTADGKWKYRLCIAETITYESKLRALLSEAENMGAPEIYKLHAYYGNCLGQMVRTFIHKNSLTVDFIASHGHTIFHQPQHKFTTQIGDGASIYAVTGIQTITDFRGVDVACGGQGAPLVPVGERDLFGDYGMFLNLGGIANLTVFDSQDTVRATDIAPCNMAMNILCEKYFNQSFDKNGLLAESGQLNSGLLRDLLELDYFSAAAPKSLGKEFMNAVYMPLIESYAIPANDKLHTVAQHASTEIANAINEGLSLSRKNDVLVTGGGTYNLFLMNLLKQKSNAALVVPDPLLVEFKEALIFAYLGLLRLTKKPNALASVTHATKDSIGGALWG